jgi:arylsulfatase A-like enzyme
MVLGLIIFILPGILRVSYLISSGDPSLLAGPRNPMAHAIVLGVATLPQDLAIALEVMLLPSALGTLAAAHPWVVALIGAVVAGVGCLYLIADHILVLKCRFRLRHCFAPHVFHLSNYTKSAAALGVKRWPLVLVPVLAAACCFSGMLAVTGPAGSSQLTLLLGLGSLASFGAALYAERCLPAKTAWIINNILYSEQCELVREWWTQFKSVWEEPVAGKDFAEQEQYVQTKPGYPLCRETRAYTGERQFDLTLAGTERPHVLLLFMESFRAANIGVIGGDTPASPEFDRLSKEGVLFTNFYCNGIQTSRAVTASLFGILPRHTFAPEQSDLQHLPRLRGLPQLFSELGYIKGFLHNGDLQYENQGEFFSNTGFEELVGMSDLQRLYPEATNLSGWGLPDEFLMRHYVDWLARHDTAGHPSFATMFTISNHHPFTIPEGFNTPAFECGGDPQKDAFLRSFYYSDWCLGLLFRLLRERGLYDKLVVGILGDTGQPMGEHYSNYSQQSYLFEESIHIPLLLLAPGRLRRPAVIRDPGSQVDLLPTFIDLFDQRFLHHAFGSSLLRHHPGRKVFFNNPYALRTRGERQGRWKYLHEQFGDESFLFDLESDPGETTNLADAEPKRTAEMRDDTIRIHRIFTSLYSRDRFC